MNDSNDVHSSIVSIVASVVAFDDKEARDRADILDWLRSTTDVYRRVKPSIPDRHMAVYCVPVDLAEHRIFLGFHLGAQHWLPPGGHVDIGEFPRCAALRECEEELGMVPNLYRDSPILASLERTVGMNVHTDVVLWFAFDCSAQMRLSLTEEEFGDQRWFSFSEISNLHTNPNLGRFLTKLKRLHTAATPAVSEVGLVDQRGA